MEIWKDIIGYEGLYQVSNLGRVRIKNYRNTGKSKIMKTQSFRGWERLLLCKDGNYKAYFVHRLVAIAFIPNPLNKPEVDHINTIRNDNRVENLKWTTRKENSNNPLTKKHHSEKSINNVFNSKPVLQYTIDGTFLQEWPSQGEIQRKCGYYQSAISQCCLGKVNTAYGYIWKYKEVS